MTLAQRVGQSLLDLAYPQKCVLCGRLGESLCEVCVSEFEPHDPLVEFFDSGLLAYRASLYRYRGAVADAVQALKYARRTAIASWMAEQLGAAPERLGLEFDVVAPVPIHWSRRAMRGFNQSELLSANLPFELGLLIRVRSTPPQVGLTREQRNTNLVGAFEASASVAGKKIMLVDDVLTSGSTARECAKALIEKGASEVGILTFSGDKY